MGGQQPIRLLAGAGQYPVGAPAGADDHRVCNILDRCEFLIRLLPLTIDTWLRIDARGRGSGKSP
jgi:hypothetical protein